LVICKLAISSAIRDSDFVAAIKDKTNQKTKRRQRERQDNAKNKYKDKGLFVTLKPAISSTIKDSAVVTVKDKEKQRHRQGQYQTNTKTKQKQRQTQNKHNDKTRSAGQKDEKTERQKTIQRTQMSMN